MKIIGGQFKGRNFFMPKDVRPTTSIIRKALFDIIGPDLDGVDFLDLFAGSGSIGLEAVSRGAKSVVMVEKDLKNYRVIAENLKLFQIPASLDKGASCDIFNLDSFVAIKTLHKQNQKFDVVFIDPPYERGLAKKALNCLAAYDILHANCVVIIEHSKRETLPEKSGRFLAFRQKKYGSKLIDFYQ